MIRNVMWLVRLLYLPLFLLVGNGVAVYLVAEDFNAGWLGLLILVFIGISFATERLIPYDRAFNEPQRDQRRDVLHALMNESLNVIGIAVLPLIAGLLVLAPIWPSSWPLLFQLLLAILISDIGITLAHFASHRLRLLWRLHAVHHSVKRLYGFNGLMKHPLLFQLLLAILISDIGITLAHFASHRLRLLWRLHAVHHSVKRLYGFNGLMKHPLHQFIETVAGTTPLLIIGVPQNVLMLLVVAVVFQLLLQHSNVAYFTGPLKKVLAINSVHRFHHLNTAKEGDVNFGLFTTLTDRFLGTAYFDSERTIGAKDLGIASEPNYPTNYWQQLMQPFQRNRR